MATSKHLPLFPLHEAEPIASESAHSLKIVQRIPLSSQTKSLTAKATSLSDDNLQDLQAASDLLSSVLSLKANIISYHLPLKKRAKEAHESACHAEHCDLDPVVSLEKQLKSIIASLELKRRQAKAEADRLSRLAAEAEAAAIQKQILEAATQAGASSESLVSLAGMGMLVPVPQTNPELERPKGFSASDQFDVEVIDIKALAQAVLDGKAPLETIQGNAKVLAGMAKALNGNLQIPGVRIQRSISVSGRKAR